MNDDPATLGGLVDIEPPATPILYVLENSAVNIVITTLLMTVLFLAVAFLLWKRYFSIKGRARRKIQNLQHKVNTQEITQHDMTCLLSRILREYLVLETTLNRADIPEVLAAHKMRWKAFTEQLSFACYSPLAQEKELAPEKISLLFDDAYFWIKAWPDRKHV